MKAEKQRTKILLIEDDEDDFILVRESLSKDSPTRYDLEWVQTYGAALEAISGNRHDVYLLDYRLGERSGLDLLHEAVGNGCRAPFILLTAQGDYEVDMEAMRAGAADYLVKGELNASLLERSIRYAIEHKRTEEELQRYRERLEDLVVERTEELAVAVERLEREIRERRRAEEKIHRREQEYKALAENSPDVIVRLDRELRRIYVNPAIEAQTGLPPSSFLGRPIHDPVIPERTGFLHLLEEMCRRVFATGIEETMEHEFMTPKGLRYFHTRLAPELSKGGEVESVLTVCRDVTDLKVLEKKLRTANEWLENRVEERTAELKKANRVLKESETMLRSVSSRLLHAQEEERKRIARELHDSISSSLSAIKFGMETAIMQMGEESAGAQLLNPLVSVTQQTIEEARRLMADLRPSVLDDLGIVVTIGWLCRQFEGIYSNIRIEKKIGVEEDAIPEPLKIVIFRIIQEALHNVARHSRATVVRLSLMRKDGRIELSIRDNGKGFDPGSITSAKGQRGGQGLSGMRERTELSGGAFSLRSALGKGTEIRASWPCA